MSRPTLPSIDNRQARWLLLERQGLSARPSRAPDKAALLSLIRALGYVQVDSINTVERAHHTILFSRNQRYRREHLRQLLEEDRSLFENWTHDAAIIPSEFYPYWQARFAEERSRLEERWSRWRRTGFMEALDEIRRHVTENGELMARHTSRAPGGGGGDGWWDWHPSKTALEFLWRTGELAVTRRDGFQKVYDLSERILPQAAAAHPTPSRREVADWACDAALERLGAATPGELAAFWDAVPVSDAHDWVRRQGDRLRQASLLGADGRERRVWVRPELLEVLDALPPPPTRLRLLSPFDPILRDRARCERLFGFRYRIEVFVPAARRRYGYYVFPMLEGDRLVGRIDLKLRRDAGCLDVQGLWWEAGVRRGGGRIARLHAELARIARFVGAEEVRWTVPERGLEG